MFNVCKNSSIMPEMDSSNDKKFVWVFALVHWGDCLHETEKNHTYMRKVSSAPFYNKEIFFIYLCPKNVEKRTAQWLETGTVGGELCNLRAISFYLWRNLQKAQHWRLPDKHDNRTSASQFPIYLVLFILLCCFTFLSAARIEGFAMHTYELAQLALLLQHLTLGYCKGRPEIYYVCSCR